MKNFIGVGSILLITISLTSTPQKHIENRSFSMRKVTWNLSLEEVKNNELPLKPISDTGIILQYDDELFGLPVKLSYVFSVNELVLIKYNIALHKKDASQYLKFVLKSLRKKYGKEKQRFGIYNWYNGKTEINVLKSESTELVVLYSNGALNSLKNEEAKRLSFQIKLYKDKIISLDSINKF